MAPEMKNHANVKIGRFCLGERFPVFVIAEAGVNHNGRLELAKKLIDAAQKAGADAIKFQTFKSESLVTAHAPQADYQKRTSPYKDQLTMLKELELSSNNFRELFLYCHRKKIMFLSTPFDEESVELLAELNVPAFKVSSGDLTNFTLLKKIARYHKPVLLSTGMATLAEVREAVECIYRSGNHQLILFHCTSNYPTAFNDVNLKALRTLQKKFHVPVGFSDHTVGIETAVAAVAMGCCVIEKHLTLDKNFDGPDHQASSDPREFQSLVNAIRHVEMALGDGQKKPTKSEEPIKRVARKSIVAVLDIAPGEKLTRAMLTVKRPGTGIEPKWLGKLIGARVRGPIKKDQVLSWPMVK